MKNARFLWLILSVFWWGFSGCATGKALTVPGELYRPAGAGGGSAAGAPAVAVLDFEWGRGRRDSEIGRDYDQVRSIVWDGAPGKSMADLIARALEEKGVRAVRVPGEAQVPAEVPSRVWGRVDEFRVDVRRTRSVQVTAEARVAVTINGAGPNSAPGWNSAVSSASSNPEPLFIMASEVLRAINDAANAVAEEAVRRLVDAGVVRAPSSGAPGNGGAAR